MAGSLSQTPGVHLQDNGCPLGASVLLCGYNDLAELTLEILEEFGQRAVVVAPCPPPSRKGGWQYLQGDPHRAEVLRQAGIEQIKVALLLEDNDQANFELALLIRDLNPQARIVSRLFGLNFAAAFFPLSCRLSGPCLRPQGRLGRICWLLRAASVGGSAGYAATGAGGSGPLWC